MPQWEITSESQRPITNNVFLADSVFTTGQLRLHVWDQSWEQPLSEMSPIFRQKENGDSENPQWLRWPKTHGQACSLRLGIIILAQKGAVTPLTILQSIIKFFFAVEETDYFNLARTFFFFILEIHSTLFFLPECYGDDFFLFNLKRQHSSKNLESHVYLF